MRWMGGEKSEMLVSMFRAAIVVPASSLTMFRVSIGAAMVNGGWHYARCVPAGVNFTCLSFVRLLHGNGMLDETFRRVRGRGAPPA